MVTVNDIIVEMTVMIMRVPVMVVVVVIVLFQDDNKGIALT